MPRECSPPYRAASRVGGVLLAIAVVWWLWPADVGRKDRPPTVPSQEGGPSEDLSYSAPLKPAVPARPELLPLDASCPITSDQEFETLVRAVGENLAFQREVANRIRWHWSTCLWRRRAEIPDLPQSGELRFLASGGFEVEAEDAARRALRQCLEWSPLEQPPAYDEEFDIELSSQFGLSVSGYYPGDGSLSVDLDLSRKLDILQTVASYCDEFPVEPLFEVVQGLHVVAKRFGDLGTARAAERVYEALVRRQDASWRSFYYLADLRWTIAHLPTEGTEADYERAKEAFDATLELEELPDQVRRDCRLSAQHLAVRLHEMRAPSGMAPRSKEHP